jgi:hypothetical protein
MISKWSPAQRERITNDILATYGIPVVVNQVSLGEASWAVRVFGGTIETVLDCIHQKQDSIVRRSTKWGLNGISRQDALFMYVSQWLEYTVNGGEKDDDRESVENIIEYWLHAYNMLSSQLVN